MRSISKELGLDIVNSVVPLLINQMYKFTINNVRIEPKFVFYLITRALNDASVVGRAKNTHLIIYHRKELLCQ